MAKTIMTVDDSPSMRKMICLALQGAGYQCVEAQDGLDGLKKAQAVKCDAIIADQNMPNMDGITFVREIKKTARYASTPIIMLSSDSRADLKQMAREAGALGWMVKPFDQATLIAAVRKVVGA